MNIAIAALIFQIFAPDPVFNSANKTSTINSDLKKLYTTCIVSKSTQIVKWYKSMIPANEKLEQIYTNLRKSHNPPFRSGNIYTIILIYKHTKKIWTHYL